MRVDGKLWSSFAARRCCAATLDGNYPLFSLLEFNWRFTMKRKMIVLLGGLAISAVACSFYVTTTSHAQDAVMDEKTTTAETEASPLMTQDISLEQAHVIIAAAIAKAGEIDTKMDIAIVDAGGNLKAFVRMDGAWLGSIDIAIKKAKTARYFDMNTGTIGELSQPGGPLYNIEHSNDGLITFPGGVPLLAEDGTVIGAIGVSGSSVENDHTVAAAGAEAI